MSNSLMYKENHIYDEKEIEAKILEFVLKMSSSKEFLNKSNKEQVCIAKEFIFKQ